jgi:hypothetical protein
MLCKIWGFQGGDYEECRLLGLTPCGSFKNRLFGGTFTSFISVKRLNELRRSAVTRNWSTPRRNTTVASSLISPLWWRRYVPPKRRLLREPYSAKSQQTAFLIRISTDRKSGRTGTTRGVDVVRGVGGSEGVAFISEEKSAEDAESGEAEFS